MEYTIQKLAELAGVTTRTLRWYHRIGLLTPQPHRREWIPILRRAEVDRSSRSCFTGPSGWSWPDRSHSG